jgi:hypothetical protein
MVKVQVHIPDDLYREAKRIARETEMSFAEVVRRGLEKMVKSYPASRGGSKGWQPPKPHDLGKTLVTEEDWTALSHK